MSRLFSPLTLRNLEIKNRVFMPPMCMYSADSDGLVNDIHLVHYGARAESGIGMIIVEATGIEPRGRISAKDLGIWSSEHIAPLKRLVDMCHNFGAKMAIQLNHAGRKSMAGVSPIIAPSAIAFDEKSDIPEAMTEEQIKEVVGLFSSAAIRAKEAGFDAIEIHSAHGYLLSEFLSPLSNKRTDLYGGSAVNRARILKEVIQAIRKEWSGVLIVRVSADDLAEGGNTPEDIVEILNEVKSEGIDLVNVSSGGIVPKLGAGVKIYPGYQIGYAQTIKEKTGLPVIGGGLITTYEHAESIVGDEKVDGVFLGRILLAEPNWCKKAIQSSKNPAYRW